MGLRPIYYILGLGRCKVWITCPCGLLVNFLWTAFSQIHFFVIVYVPRHKPAFMVIVDQDEYLFLLPGMELGS